MTKTSGDIAQTLKVARQAKGLSQRALSQRAGVPQGHISNIERGTVDLRLSSLVAIARVLDLELALVPRKTVPAVRSIVRSAAAEQPIQDKTARRALREFQLQLLRAPRDAALSDLRHHAHALEHLQLRHDDAALIQGARVQLRKFLSHEDDQSLEEATALLRAVLNTRTLDVAARSLAEPARPAYSLDENDDG